MEEKIPLVSVIIPMFNSAKLIPQTLESLCYQTMQDFEVIVIDDCSTDNSVEVVESFAEKFCGRLHVIKLPENTGTPGLPRNKGIKAARGKYIAFLDSDDLYTKTALEELSNLGEKYQTDVIMLHKYFKSWGGVAKSADDPQMTDFEQLTDLENSKVKSYRHGKIKKPTFESLEVGERIKKWLSFPTNGFWRTWLFFYRRDFLVTNQITFSAMYACEDLLFAFEVLCLAEKFLNAPNIVNIQRIRIDSASRNDYKKRQGEVFFIRRLRVIREGFKKFEQIAKKIPFLQNNPDCYYDVLNWFAGHRIWLMRFFYEQNPAYVWCDSIKKEVQPDDIALFAYLFNTVNIYQREIIQLRQENAELKEVLQKTKEFSDDNP